MAKVLLKPRFRGWSVHSLYSEIIKNPPEGFTIELEKNKRIDSQLYKIDNKNINPILKEILFHLKPIPYIIAQKLEKNDFSNYDLIYASQHVLFNSTKPWITDLEFANALVAYGNINLVKTSLSKALAANECKFILPWSEWAKRTLLCSLDCSRFEEKVMVLRYTVNPKKFVRESKDGINFLFVGSSNKMNEQNIRFKSLKEVIIAFKRISKSYDGLTLTIRSFLTPEIKEMIKNDKNIISIESFLNTEELYDLYRKADVFVLPSHETSGISLLDAMSFELPVIALNIYDIPEVITHLKSGILIDGHEKMNYYTKSGIPYDYSRRFLKDMSKYSNYLVDELASHFIKLVEDSKFRKNLGIEARRIIEMGDLSIQKRNADLRHVFESSIR